MSRFGQGGIDDAGQAIGVPAQMERIVAEYGWNKSPVAAKRLRWIEGFEIES
jgi:hypothetical protein